MFHHELASKNKHPELQYEQLTLGWNYCVSDLKDTFHCFVAYKHSLFD